MKKLLCALLSLQFLILTPAMAQSGANANDDLIKTTQMDILTVAGAAGAGAILGLSTLSFVDKPSQHLRNVWTGAAIGMIAGVIYVAYNSAQRGSEDLQSSIEFSTSERVAWHTEKAPDLTVSGVQFGTQIFHLAF